MRAIVSAPTAERGRTRARDDSPSLLLLLLLPPVLPPPPPPPPRAPASELAGRAPMGVGRGGSSSWPPAPRAGRAAAVPGRAVSQASSAIVRVRDGRPLTSSELIKPFVPRRRTV